MNTKNNATARMSYDNVKQTLFEAWVKNFGNPEQVRQYVESLKLAESEVRLENTLTANNTNYTFGVTPQQNSTSGVKFRSEQRLNQGDTLIITSYGIFVGLPLTTDPNDVNWKLESYANPFIFGAADAALINNFLYSNGNLKLTVNNDVLIPNIDLWRNVYVPQTQQTAALGAGSPMDQICGAEDGFVAVEPNLYLIGTKNSIPEIILPAAMAALTATTARVVIKFRGFLAQNSTVFS